MFAFLLGFASIRADELPAGIMPQKRQVAGTGVSSQSPQPQPSTSSQSPQPQPSSNPPPTTSEDNTPTSSNTQQNNPSSSVPTVIQVTTTNSDGSTVTSSVSTKTLVPKSSSAVETKSGSKNSVVKVGSKTIDPATLSKKTTVRQPLVTQETRKQTLTSTWTGADGQVHHSVYTTENVFASTTGYATATIAPSLANGGGDGSNLSSHTKAIIGGVVGGIGGAILIGGLAFVAWRLWGKKRQEADADDYSYSPHDSINAQKRYSGATLMTDGYQSTGPSSQRVNTASNF